MKGKRWLYYPVAVCLLFVTFSLRLYRFAELGTQADEGAIASAASRLLAGDLLYQDLFWNHVPGIIYLLAATFKIAGPSLLLSRLLSVGAAMLTVAGLVLASRQVGVCPPGQVKAGAPQWAHFLPGLLFACAPLPIFWSRFSMMENWHTAFSTLGIACALLGLKTRVKRWWALDGVMVGMALLFKISALVLVGTFGLFLGVWWLTRPRWEPVHSGLLFLVGLVLALLPLMLVLLVQGTVADFSHFLSGPDRLSPLFDWRGKLGAVLEWGIKRPFVPLALLGGLFALLSRRPACLLLLTWAGAETIMLLSAQYVQFGWSGYSHYALPVVAAMSLLAGGGLGWAWQATEAKPRRRLVLAAVGVLLVIGTLPGLQRDLKHVVSETTYPLPGFATEKAVARALALVTPNREPILVFANGIFYHWADRPPANRYFHYPGYLSTSSLAAESEKELTAALGNPSVGAVLLSGVHRKSMSPAILNTVLDKWVAVARFSYPYQKDVLLYLPTEVPSGAVAESTAFENGVSLKGFEAQVLAPETVLVRLEWSAASRLGENYSVFTHLVGPDGTLVMSHDGWPVLGLRPTTTWQPGELIVDYHWLELPADLPADRYAVRVGLYELPTGERLRVQTANGFDAGFAVTHVQLGH